MTRPDLQTESITAEDHGDHVVITWHFGSTEKLVLDPEQLDALLQWWGEGK